MGNLITENKDIKISKSAFCVYKNEVVKYEGKQTTPQRFAYNLNNGIFRAIEIEILNAIYQLKFATSRQITEYLELFRGISDNQSNVAKRLIKLHNNSTVSRYSFTSDEIIGDTNFKAYKLENNGKRLLLARKYECNWNPVDTSNLDEIKKYLARNQYVLRLKEDCGIEEVNLNLKTAVGAIYNVKDSTHIVLPIRRNELMIGNNSDIVSILTKAESDTQLLRYLNKKYIIVGEDIQHLIQIFITLVKAGIYQKMPQNIYFTEDLRLLDRHISKSFVRLGLNKDAATNKINYTVDEITNNDLV